MSISIRPYRKRGAVHKGKWEVDIQVRTPDGQVFRERRCTAAPNKTIAKEWAEKRVAHLLTHGPEKEEEATDQIPPSITFKVFVPKFREWAVIERKKPSTLEAYRSHLDYHLLPMFGDRPLASLSKADVQALKVRLKENSQKTVNNVFATISKLLTVATELIDPITNSPYLDEVPVQFEGKKAPKPVMEFYEPEKYADLIEAATKIDPRTLITVLLGGDAGLRAGEILALEWPDLDLKRGIITVARSEWDGFVTTPKGGQPRKVPMTKRLQAALKAFQVNRLKGPRVLFRDDETPMSEQTLRSWMSVAQRRANLRDNGGRHILRHTFCSHLAMRGATAMVIKELAGHQDLSTTMGYMHLGPSQARDAIALLNLPLERASAPAEAPNNGAIVEPGDLSAVTS